MTSKQFVLLLIPSVLWGSSFVFMKILAPIYGPILTATLRIVAASVFLLLYFKFINFKVEFKQNWKHYALIGIGNSAIPFSLYAYAALFIDSSFSVILNSTSPLFGAMFGYFMLKDRLSLNKVIGLLLGFVGVVFISSFAIPITTTEVVIAILACLGAASLYGLSGIYVKKYVPHIDSKRVTAGSLSFASMFLIVLSFIIFLTGNTSIEFVSPLRDVLLIIIFGILCTSIPYLVYYRLLVEIGPVKALTVTYLMPVFGLIWSIIYGETIGVFSIIGLFIILGSIYILSINKEEH